MTGCKWEPLVSIEAGQSFFARAASFLVAARRVMAQRKAAPLNAYLPLSALTLLLTSPVFAQIPFPYNPVQDTSYSPARAYTGSNIDIIDLDTGALTVKIPLISYPQRGGILPGDFTFVDSNHTVVTKYTIPYEQGRQEWVFIPPVGYSANGIILNGFPMLASTTSPVGTDQHFYQAWVSETDGSNHLVGWIDGTHGRSVDGTGYFVNNTTTPYTVIDKEGVKTNYGTSSSPVTMTDPNGNQMTLSNAGGATTITDTVGRTFSLNYATGKFVFPGVNGSTVTFGLSGDVLTLPDTTTYKFEGASLALPLLPGQTTAQSASVLKLVTLPTGGTISWGYPSIPVVSPCPGYEYIFPVSSRTVNANDGSGPQTWGYTYSLSSTAAGTTTVTDPLQQKTVYTYGLTSCQPYPTKIQTFDPKGNLLKTVTKTYSYVSSPNATQYLNVNETSETTTWPNGLQSKVTMTYDRDNGSGFKFATLLLYTESTLEGAQDYGSVPAGYSGLPWTTTSTDFGTNSPGPLLRQVKTQYLAFSGPNASSYLADNFLEQPYTKQTLDGAGTQKALTTYNYDESNGGPSGVRGNLTSVSRWLNTGATVKTQTVFNNEGMPAKVCQAIDPGCANSTIYTYDSTGMFPSSVQLPTTGTIRHIDHVVYDKNTGQLTSHTDPNGVVTTYAYSDPLNRLTLVESAVGALNWLTGGSAQSNTAYKYPSATETDAEQDLNKTNDAALVSKTIYDGLGRPFKAIARDGSVIETGYDALSRPCVVSNATLSANAPTTLNCAIGQNKATAATDGYTYFSYDALGRKTLQTQPDGKTLQWQYTGNVLDYRDEDLSHWQWTSDGLGRQTKTLENDPAGSGALSLETDYTYDPLGNLLSVNQKGATGDTGRSRTFVYDSLSRLTNACNPEAIGAPGKCTPTSGPWSKSYTYDADGNALTRTDARAIVSHYTYDALNRLAATTYTNDPANTPALAYGYDVENTTQPVQHENNPIGHLNSIQANLGTTNLVTWTSGDYDQRGHLTGYLNCFAQMADGCEGLDTAGNLGYDLNEDLVSLTADAGYATESGQVGSIAYGYDTAGRLNSIATNLELNLSNEVLISTEFSGLTYFPGGEVQTAKLGIDPDTNVAAISLTRSFDNRGRITGETDRNSAQQTSYSYTVGYDGNSNVSSYNDSVAGSWLVKSDALHRLLSSTGTYNGKTGTFQETYDHFGNRNVEYFTYGGSESQPSPYLNFTAGNNRVDTYSYDNAGNLLSDGTNNYLYDAENRICAVEPVASGGSIIGYLYSPDGSRLGKGAITKTFSCDFTKNGMLQASGRVALTTEYNFASNGDLVEQTYTDSYGSNYFLDHFNVSWQGRLLGTYTGTTYSQSNWSFALNDWIGTKRLVVKEGANPTSFFSGPFGDYLNQNGANDPSDQHFSGKERDVDSSLSYFLARHYSSNLGRFMSPDWAERISPVPYADLGNPQSLNLYGYVQNNPLSHVDANGHVQLCGPTTISVHPNEDMIVNGNCTDLPDPPSFFESVGNSFSQLGASLSTVISKSLGSSGGPRAGKRFSQADKKLALKRNAEANGGRNVCENCGQPVIPGQQSKAGVTPAQNEANIDHTYPRSQGGDANPDSNAGVLCRGCNIEKSDSLPTTGEPIEPVTPVEPVFPIEPIGPIEPLIPF